MFQNPFNEFDGVPGAVTNIKAVVYYLMMAMPFFMMNINGNKKANGC